jgi:acyl carrier protein
MTTIVPGDLVDLLLEVVHVDGDLLTPDTRFIDLGRTSSDELDLLVAIEDRYRITVDFPAFVALETVGELAEAIAAATAEGGGRRLGGA